MAVILISRLFVLLTCALYVLGGRNFYKILDLDRSASDADIKKAYKRLSRKFHPDRNKDEGAEAKFVEITQAYEALSDPEKRQIYDRHGEEGLQAHEGGQHSNPFDVFSNFFGGGHPPRILNLADVYTGNSVEFMIKKKILCDHCRGTGANSDGDIKTCPTCNGSGVKTGRQQIFPGIVSGKGKVIARPCKHCNGEKVIDHTGHYTLEVEKGMPEGHEVVFEGEGDQSAEWEAGDVVLRIRTQKVAGGWRRKESSLYWKETISVAEALLGFERNITHLDGHQVTISRPGPTGYTMVVKDEGMPIYEGHGHGDLYVEFNVVLPTVLSEDTRKKLQEAFKTGKGRGKDEL
ncbi:SubName: Full=Related to SCJ1 protein {ECO:0000313/EMBL:CCA74956.1} [Serendipita indica DSM 11827]|nr:SubName: Full=Related to SCJ1 protein {ECO:0000313/EMBL:CCA74956.1} [Serendipita indica DSM 11827]